jgi:hypothetical protein
VKVPSIDRWLSFPIEEDGYMVFMRLSRGLLPAAMAVTQFFLISTSAIALSEPDSVQIDTLINEGMELIFHEHYDRADSLFDILVNAKPDHPSGYFFKGLVTWRRGYIIKDYKKYDKAITAQLSRAIDVADEALKKDEENAEALFYKGGSFGFIGTLHVRNKSWIKAGLAAYKGIRTLQKAYELDPQLWDIYYGLGLYHCAAANASGIVRFIQKLIPIPEGDSEKGLKDLQIAIEKGVYTKTAARAFLAVAYTYYEGRYRDSITILEELVVEYPRCIDFWLSLANAYFYNGLNSPVNDWKRLIAIVDITEKEVEKRGIEILPWWGNKLHFMRGYALYSLEKYQEAAPLLSRYSKEYTKKKKSYLTSLGELTLGKIADLSGDRNAAMKHYEKALDLEYFGNLKDLARHYLNEPFTKETSEWRFSGAKVDLPGRP